MSTCPWGVTNGYGDTFGHWHDTPHDTRLAILAAMGVNDPNSVPSGADPVRVVRAGQAVPWPQAGEVELEEGARLAIHGQLPPDLPLGYHRFWPASGAAETYLIVSPGQCVVPPRGSWGFAAQLYAARSQASWGMGDLDDLGRLARWSAGLGAGFVLINPLAAPAPRTPQEASPYYPSSRRFFNPLYLRVEDVPGAAALGPQMEQLAAAGRALNAQRVIDRDAVHRLKQQALAGIFAGFSGDPQFDAYCRQRGEELTQFAAYCVLAEQFGHDWRKWPAEYHSYQSAAVQAVLRDQQQKIRYQQWLQWLFDRQFQQAARELTVIQDLPIGVDPGGADAWVWQSLLSGDCTVGAPPDIFNLNGQDWQLPAFIPHKLRAAGYAPFVQTLRATLRHAGGLRIDHVMGLFRLFWIPKDFGPARGTYVRYRADEMLAILALESQRAGAFVVGEDLGTVEHGVREQLAEHRALSFRVVWFESQPPAQFPALAMAATTTHDLPTVAGLWNGSDLAEQKALNLPADEAMRRLREHLQHFSGAAEQAPADEVIEKTYRRLGEAPSLLLLATPEDALAVSERPNMPGTTSERKNWSLALPGGLEALESAPLAQRIAQALRRGG